MWSNMCWHQFTLKMKEKIINLCQRQSLNMMYILTQNAENNLKIY